NIHSNNRTRNSQNNNFEYSTENRKNTEITQSRGKYNSNNDSSDDN
ncbi:2297_t:CDS:1, partial [Scutellospora calospora]